MDEAVTCYKDTVELIVKLVFTSVERFIRGSRRSMRELFDCFVSVVRREKENIADNVDTNWSPNRELEVLIILVN